MRGIGTYAAAWLPELDGLDWDQAEGRTRHWVGSQLAQYGGKLVIVAETKSAIDAVGRGHLGGLIRSGEAITRRRRHSVGSVANRGSRVVLAIYDSPTVGEMAISIVQRGGALCMFDGGTNNLSDELKGDLDHLAFVGNNGWSEAAGKRDAPRLLADMKSRGELEKGDVLGAMLARGASGSAIERLDKMIDKKI